MNIPLNIDWQQILLHLLNFAILAGGLYLLLYKPVKAFLAKREDWYRQQADAAEETRREAEALKADAQARTDAGEDARRIREDAQTQAEKLLSDARAQAESDRRKLMEASQRQVKELVSAAAEKLLLSSDSEAFDRFLAESERGEDGDAQS